MFGLGADHDVEDVRDERDVVLRERVDDARGQVLRDEEEDRRRNRRAARDIDAGAGGDVVVRKRREVILEVDVAGVAMFAVLARHAAVRSVVVKLRLPLSAGRLRVDDARKHVRARNVDVGTIGQSLHAAIDIALQRERRPVVRIFAVVPEAGLTAADGVERTAAGGKLLRAEVAVLAVHAVCAGGALQTAVAEFGLADRRACIDVNKRTLRVFGAFPDDVDRAIDGVGAPERTRGTANHLDAIDVGQHHILLIPERAREQRRVDVAAVDHHDELVAGGVAKSARAHRPRLSVDARDLQSGDKTQRIGQRRDAGATDVVLRDDGDGSGRFADGLGVARRRGDVDPAEILQ